MTFVKNIDIVILTQKEAKENEESNKVLLKGEDADGKIKTCKKSKDRSLHHGTQGLLESVCRAS